MLERYRTVALTCRHCWTTIANYVAERGVTKVLRRVCSVCGSEQQRFMVTVSECYEVVGVAPGPRSSGSFTERELVNSGNYSIRGMGAGF